MRSSRRPPRRRRKEEKKESFIDKLKGIFGMKPKVDTGSYKKARKAAENEANNGNYNAASVHLFQALVEYGSTKMDLPRKPSQTAREYSKAFAEKAKIDPDLFEPIILQFEIARYSPFTVAQEDFEEAIAVLDSIVKKSAPTIEAKTKGKGEKRGGKRPARARARPRRQA